MKPSALKTLTLSAFLLGTTSLGAFAQDLFTIGQVTALIPEASTADDASEIGDGVSGDTAFPFLSAMKPLATVGEVDAVTGKALTGYPDGNAAFLADEATVRVIYQSESYASMSSETYPQEMSSGATFTGSHVHTIDYDRAGMADFLGNDAAAATIVKGSGHLYNRIFDVFGNEVKPKAEGGVWGNQTLPNGMMIDYAPGMELEGADFFVNSFCGGWHEPANKWGDGIGFADDVWMMAEEWNIQEMFDVTDAEGNKLTSLGNAHDTMGLASLVVDIANATAYTVPALGQTGYEKLMPINPGHPDYVVIVLAGYNHDVEPAPLKIYVGVKGMDAAGNPVGDDASERDRFLARNGLLHGKIYGLAVANDAYAGLGIDEIDTGSKMADAYLTNPDAPNTFAAAFMPTSYQWGGWDTPVAVKDTEMLKWQMAEEQPEGYTFFVGDSKTEHPAVDPDATRHRYVQNMTQMGGILGFDFGDLGAALAAAGGALPAKLDVTVTRTLAAIDGALTLEVGDKGVKHGGEGTHATWQDGAAMTVAPDGLYWAKAADGDVLLLDEDSGNKLGERKMALLLNADDLTLKEPGKGYFLAMGGGAESPRAAAGVAVMPGSFKSATSSEFSGSWNITALLARKDDGSFYTMDELAGTGEQAINQSVALNDSAFMGVIQHRGESAGQVAEVKADAGGQILMFSLDLPM
ncbi:MAG: hypothetical protein R3D59_13100 [Paracoccaceae bacterium]